MGSLNLPITCYRLAAFSLNFPIENPKYRICILPLNSWSTWRTPGTELGAEFTVLTTSYGVNSTVGKTGNSDSGYLWL